MWIFTRHGFFSMTRSTTDPDLMQIRSREREDLEQLGEATGFRPEIIETPNRDYRWRVLVTPGQAEVITRELTADIDYDNFKSAVHDSHSQRHKVQALHEIWAIMLRFQSRRPRRDRSGTPELGLTMRQSVIDWDHAAAVTISEPKEMNLQGRRWKAKAGSSNYARNRDRTIEVLAEDRRNGVVRYRFTGSTRSTITTREDFLERFQ